MRAIESPLGRLYRGIEIKVIDQILDGDGSFSCRPEYIAGKLQLVSEQLSQFVFHRPTNGRVVDSDWLLLASPVHAVRCLVLLGRVPWSRVVNDMVGFDQVLADSPRLFSTASALISRA
jgi:hypothetical protein